MFVVVAAVDFGSVIDRLRLPQTASSLDPPMFPRISTPISDSDAVPGRCLRSCTLASGCRRLMLRWQSLRQAPLDTPLQRLQRGT